MLTRRRSAALAAVLALLYLSTIACATLKPPAQLTPIGDTAYYAREIVKGVAALQDSAIDAEKTGALSTDDTRAVVEATKTAAQAAGDLAASLKSGVSQAEAKAKWVGVIREALARVPNHLSDHGKALVAPYIQVVLTLLTALD